MRRESKQNGCGVGTCESDKYGTYVPTSNECIVEDDLGTCTEKSCELICEDDPSCEMPKPDLVITDIWFDDSTIYYEIKNQGFANADSSHSKLWVDDSYESTGVVSSLPAGTASTEYFYD